MEPKMKVRPFVDGRIGRIPQGLVRLFRRLKERELFDRWQSSKTKKDETVGKKAELELRRKTEGDKDYQFVRKERREERERIRLAERFRRFLETYFQKSALQLEGILKGSGGT
ncbi:hypothetical protein H0O00_00610 [Candidatus Micrarchaeota archaeon]|nr:hypothetical protein [Candidatus Micrarchaeota archaeon]